MNAQTSSSPPFSTAGLGPCELSSSYLADDGFDMWVFWSTWCKDKRDPAKPRPPPGYAGDADAMTNSKIVYLLQLLLKTVSMELLAQFWGLVKVGDKMYLTTCDKPFALKYWDDLQFKKLCEYRKHCLDYLVPVDDDDNEISVDGAEQLIGGPPGRVFRSGLPEYAPDVRHYTTREYPQRDYAVNRVRGYCALPVYHPHRHLPSGVLEIVSSHGHLQTPYKVIQKKFQVVNLTTTCLSFVEASSCRDREIAKIDEVLSKVRGRHELADTETWTTSGEILSLHGGCDFIRKGQGVAGKAFSSKSACFCRDIRQLSITEYPLLPKARFYKYSACFAVCLKSFCLNNCSYVLEFFLPTNEKDNGDPRTLLHMILETLKENLRGSFEIASGQELGGKLSVEVIKVSSDDKFDSFEVCNNTGTESTSGLSDVHGGEGIMQSECLSLSTVNASVNRICGIAGSLPRLERVQDFVNMSDQELMTADFNSSNLARVDAPINSMNGIYEQQNRTVGFSPGQELAQNIVSIVRDVSIAEINVANPERDGASIEQSGDEAINIKKQNSSFTLKRDLGITREVLEQNSWRNLDQAAEALQVSRSTLKRICREYGISRWPPRKARKVTEAFAGQRVVEPSTENIEEHHWPDKTKLEDDSTIWVKAEYQRYIIKFRLPLSARKSNLEENVAQRLNLSIGSFKIEYQDEDNDWIWIASDEDLSTCMSTLSSLGRTTIKMLVT